MSYEAVDFYVNDATPMQNPVSGVVVKITSQDGKITYSQGSTDAAGHAGFMLPSGLTYQARFYKFAVGFINPQLFTVLPSPLAAGQTNTFSVVAQILTPPVPTDARLCTCYGYFRDITGAPQSNVEIHFIAKFDPVWLDGAGVLKERVIIRTDEKGYAQVNLIRNGQYDCTIQGEEDIVRHISVPDAPNVNLPDLIFPVVSSLVLTPPGPYTVQAGQELAIGFVVMGSDGENLGVGYGDILITTSDNDILGYAYTRAGLTLIGIKAGTAQLNVVRADQSIVRIPDTGIANQPLLVTVTP